VVATIREEMERFIIEREVGDGLFRKESLWALVEKTITDAVEEERKRIIKEIHVSRDSRPIWSHVDSYGLGQVLKGNPWPEDR